jgi:hypothetical protein
MQAGGVEFGMKEGLEPDQDSSACTVCFDGFGECCCCCSIVVVSSQDEQVIVAGAEWWRIEAAGLVTEEDFSSWFYRRAA